MKIASFNVNSLRVRLPLVLQWLTANEPVVLCVQETKVQDFDFPAGAFEEIGYRYAFKGQKTYNGVAIFSKSNIENVELGFENEPFDKPRLIKAEIDGVAIVNTYIPQGYLVESEKFEYKLDWFKRLRQFFESHFTPAEAVVWVGDLNVAPLPIDVHDPDGLFGHVCYNAEVHRALNEVIQWGFVDVFRKHCDKSGQYTFWDYRIRGALKRNLGWRLDHIMATESLANKSISCYIDKEPRAAQRPSDHTPIIAEFDW